MSEVINNREYRQKVLKELIMELHNGKPVEEVKAKFGELIEGVSTSEISQMEQNLIMEGMPVTEVQRLCDVHAAVFKGSIEEIHREVSPEEREGHPVHTFKTENREIEKLIVGRIRPDLEVFKDSDARENISRLSEDMDILFNIDKHYSRKENLLFPYLEKYGITAPPKVMWGVDDEIRDGIKDVKRSLAEYKGNKDGIARKFSDVIDKVNEMIFKEENILFPMALETLAEDEWFKIAEESEELGYFLIKPDKQWAQNRQEAKEENMHKAAEGIKLDTGALSNEELNSMMKRLPFDITFIDKNDIVKYFTQGNERIFARTAAVIGRTVQNCHPPASVHIVEKMLQDFKSGRKDHEDFWIMLGDLFVYIRYFAVRDDKGGYIGTLEVTQNIKPMQQLHGEKRLMT